MTAKRLAEAEERLQDNDQDLECLHEREKDLLSTNKEMSENLVKLQNENCLLKSMVNKFQNESVFIFNALCKLIT